VLIIGMDALAKLGMALYPVVMVVWARYVFHLATTPVLGLSGGGVAGLVKTRRLGIQVMRSLLMFASTVSFFTALNFIPLADAVAIGFVTPLLITLLAVPMLGERVGPRRVIACAVGFAGALLIVRPGFEDRHWAYLLPLVAALTAALYGILTRRLGRSERATTSLFYMALIGGLLSSAVVPFHWRTPDAGGWLLLAATGVLAAVSHLLLIQAYRHAPVSVVAPYGYLDIVWATFYGLALFGDFPDAPSWVGVAVIVGSGLYVFHREARVKADRPG
jgi:drug/metabolite transporter (DMT)-like permease